MRGRILFAGQMSDKPKQLQAVAIGCFREAQLVGLLLGDEPE